jgi:uncharacterized protein YqjF (DUF2071 family)
VLPRPFLTARWEHLVVLTYAVSPDVLRPRVPRGTELDLWRGESLVSLVGFHFRDTRVRGIAVPGHRDFEEVNLRFYVRRVGAGPVRRAVVFIRELVPRSVVAAIARWRYNEPYLAVPMTHAITGDAERGCTIRYTWRHRGERFAIEAVTQGPPDLVREGSEAEFITEHHWGYTRQRDGGTLEYEVEHPRWRVWAPSAFAFTGPAPTLYGATLGAALGGAPRSVFVADGSPVVVHSGRRVA